VSTMSPNGRSPSPRSVHGRGAGARARGP